MVLIGDFILEKDSYFWFFFYFIFDSWRDEGCLVYRVDCYGDGRVG